MLKNLAWARKSKGLARLLVWILLERDTSEAFYLDLAWARYEGETDAVTETLFYIEFCRKNKGNESFVSITTSNGLENLFRVLVPT